MYKEKGFMELFPYSDDTTFEDANLQVLKKELQKVKINSCLIIENGSCVFEYYKNKKIAGKPQTLNSISKSVVSLLIGIALEEGLIPSLDTPIVHYFERFMEKVDDERKLQITIDHLLTMTPGFDWPEFGEWQAIPKMLYAPHWVKFVLNRPLTHNPGEHMNYNTGATHLLTAILQQASGMKASAFAEKHLFNRLKIEEYRWYEDPQGVNNGGCGLCLRVSDLPKIGYLYLNKGMWNDERIVSERWVEESTTPLFLTYNIGHYARHWWTNHIDQNEPWSEENRYYFAMGYGGQYIIIIPSRQVVIVMTSEMYNDTHYPRRLAMNTLFSMSGHL